MKPFSKEEIKEVISHLQSEIEQNLTEFKGLSSDFPYERNQTRIEKPRFNIIKKFHVPMNYKIEIEFMPDCAGRAKWVGKRIILNDVLNDVESIKTLVHEWTHMRLHLTNNAVEIEHSLKEVEAESVAFVIMTLLGLLDDGQSEWNLNESLNYIIRYLKESGKTTKEIFKFSSKRIERNVDHILNKYLISAY